MRAWISAVEQELQRRGVVAPIAELVEAVALSPSGFDVWRVLLDPELLSRVVDEMSTPFRELAVTKVLGVDGRGLAFASGVALQLRAGLLPARAPGTFLPGALLEAEAGSDYLKRSVRLAVQRDALRRRDRVLVVDDWAETGSHLRAAAALVEAARADLVGISVVIDQLPSGTSLPNFHAVTRYLPLSGRPDG